MTSILIFALAFWTLCLLFFMLIQKPIFSIVNRRCAKESISIRDIAEVYRHGTLTDAIVASYLTALPLIMVLVNTFTHGTWINWALLVYSAVIAVALGALTVSDTVLYGFWQSKIDSSVFAYLRNPKAAFASVSTIYLLTGIVASLAVGGILFIGTWGAVNLLDSLNAPIHSWREYAVCTLIVLLNLGVMFIIIRGLGIRPHSPSNAFFSKDAFLNHWALNPTYNVIYTLSQKDEYKGRYQWYPTEECDAIIDRLYPNVGIPQRSLLKTDRPNILLIVWESFGAEFTGVLGDMAKNITPQFDRLAKEGILFSRCLAGSLRTDRGLVCLLSGIPGQPQASVMRHSSKLPKLPGLPRRLAAEGYHTEAIQGGDLTIMHKNEYFLACGHESLKGHDDMPAGSAENKWGVHDGDVMTQVANDIIDSTSRGERWFKTLLTLSSHEPFDVPYNRLADKVDNSFAYTDHCLGEMVERLRNSDAWDNLLIIFVADHGFNRFMQAPDRGSFAHIPVLWLGGAIKGPEIIDTPMSQTDLAATLLGQMGMPHDEFIFSRDIMADTYTYPFAMHVYSNGFYVSDSRGDTEFDNITAQAVKGGDHLREEIGKATTQKVHSYLAQI